MPIADLQFVGPYLDRENFRRLFVAPPDWTLLDVKTAYDWDRASLAVSGTQELTGISHTATRTIDPRGTLSRDALVASLQAAVSEMLAEFKPIDALDVLRLAQ